MHRVLDLAQSKARLRVKNRQLVIERAAGTCSIPLDEAAIVVVSQGQVTFSNSVLVGIAKSGGVFVTCDSRHQPVAMLMPIASHHLQVERFQIQFDVQLPVKKRIWQQVVRAKITHQAATLKCLHGDSYGIEKLVAQVKSGDPKNVEARAARRYWPLLFSDKDFRRNRDLPGLNAILNYGYAVLRAIVARAICSCGLHPAIGIHHHNRYGMFPLADDLMEPFRPLVDLEVAANLTHLAEQGELTPTIKKAILEIMLGKFNCDGESRNLFDICNRMTNSLFEVYSGSKKKILVPELFD